MTKTATDARRAAPPAIATGAALAAMLFASRLPATLDFILPRRAGWALFRFGFEILSRPGARAAFSVCVSLPLLAAAGYFLRLAASAARARTWTARAVLTRGLSVALIGALTCWSFAIWLEDSQKILFPYGSMNALEPLMNLFVCTALVHTAMSFTLARLGPKPARVLLVFGPWIALNTLSAALTVAGRSPAAPTPERRLYIVLTEESGRPAQTAYDMPLLPPREPGRGASELEDLRALYESRAKLMDAAGLREALVLGVRRGDDLARTLLLQHLGSAPPSPEGLAALAVLADEGAHRIGSLGAARIALAYARLGRPAEAAEWAARGAARPGGIPAGLLTLPPGGALAPGRVSGTVSGLRPLRVALYRMTDPGAPYLLDAAALTASAEPDVRGRFSFSGLAAGRYYLALAFDPAKVPAKGVRVSGHRGDLTLDARRPALDVPLLTVR